MGLWQIVMTILGPVSPALALAWWLAAIALAVLMVFAWQRLLKR